MEYWRYIPIKDLDIIKAKTIDYLNKNPHTVTTTFNILPFKQYTAAVPEILTAIEGHEPRQISVYFMQDNRQGAAHIDSFSEPFRINIPIANCKGTWTCFYQLKDNIKHGVRKRLPNGEFYDHYPEEHIELVSKVEINTATIIRTSAIHSITMDEARSPRITLTMTMRPTPQLDD